MYDEMSLLFDLSLSLSLLFLISAQVPSFREDSSFFLFLDSKALTLTCGTCLGLPALAYVPTIVLPSYEQGLRFCLRGKNLERETTELGTPILANAIPLSYVNSSKPRIPIPREEAKGTK